MKECQVLVKVGSLERLLPTEEGGVTSIRVVAYFAPVDDVPLILGLDGLWDSFYLGIERTASKAYLEIL